MQHSIAPQELGNQGLHQQSSSNPKNVLMFAFYSCILFWGFNTTKLVKNALLLTQIINQKLSAMIRPKNLNSSRELVFNHNKEIM